MSEETKEVVEEAVTIEIDETPEKEEVEIDVNTGEPEVKDADKEQPEAKTDDSESKEETDKKEEVEKHPTMEEVEKDENNLKKYNKNEQALYWKWKSDRRKRQEAQKEAEEKKSAHDLAQVKLIAAKNKFDKLIEKLTSGQDVASDELVKIINDGKEAEKEAEKKPERNADDILREKIAIKGEYALKIGEAKYDRFQEIAALAKEVIAEDKAETYKKLIDESFADDNVDENTLVERIVGVAKLSPKFKDVINSAPAEKKEEIARAIKNSEKKVNSAAIAKAGGKKVITEDEITPEHVANMSQEQWNKLSEKTQKRLMGG